MPSPTHFAVRIIGIDPPEPPLDKRGNKKSGADPLCWLCGGNAEGAGWLKSDGISPTFTQTDLAEIQNSSTVCRACVALTKGSSFQEAVARHATGVKVWGTCGWHSYSHFVCEPRTYENPKPSRFREILLDPPDAPFLIAINASGQKHTIFRSRIGYGRDVFPVHFDDQTFEVDRARFTDILGVLEALSELGISKDQSLTGQYHPESIRRAGLAAWKLLEDRMRTYRSEEPQLLGLAHFCARSPSFFKNKEEQE